MERSDAVWITTPTVKMADQQKMDPFYKSEANETRQLDSDKREGFSNEKTGHTRPNRSEVKA
jgi:hypothetical protein